MGKAPVPVPCSAPNSRDSYFLPSLSLLLSIPLLPSSPSPCPHSPSPEPPACPSAQAGAACTARDQAPLSLFPAESAPPPTTPINLLPPTNSLSQQQPPSPHPGGERRSPPASPEHPSKGTPRDPPPASEEMLRWSLGAGVSFLSIPRRFPGPPAPANPYRGFPVRRRMLSWAAGCSGAGGRGGDSTWGWGHRVVSSGTPCRGLSHDAGSVLVDFKVVFPSPPRQDHSPQGRHKHPQALLCCGDHGLLPGG